jgi:hypothetical protein
MDDSLKKISGVVYYNNTVFVKGWVGVSIGTDWEEEATWKNTD